MKKWKDFGKYKVSDYGDVLSFMCMCNPDGKYLKQSINKRNGYIQYMLNDKHYYAHELVMLVWNERKINLDLHETIDHIDGDKLNNYIGNLQIISIRENISKQNRPKMSSKYTGVYFNKQVKKWQSQIEINGKLKYLGLYSDEKEASDAYQREREKLIY